MISLITITYQSNDLNRIFYCWEVCLLLTPKYQKITDYYFAQGWLFGFQETKNTKIMIIKWKILKLSLAVVDEKEFVIQVLQQAMNPQHEQGDNNKEDISAPKLIMRKSSMGKACDICFQSYHILGRWPMLACPNTHFFCDICIKGMFKISLNEPVPCPICRALMKSSQVRPYVLLFRELMEQAKSRKVFKEQQNELFIYAFNNQIFEIAALFKQNKLEELNSISRLDVSNRKIKQIQHLHVLSSLRSLYLQKNQLENVSALRKCRLLRVLNLSNNKIKEIEELGQLKQLENLSVEFNLISDISLEKFAHLKHFLLYGNELSPGFVDQILIYEFPKLLSLSYSLQNAYQTLSINFLQSLASSQVLPSLRRLFVEQLFDVNTRKSLEYLISERKHSVIVDWLNKEKIEEHERWVEGLCTGKHQFGEILRFIADPECPNMKDYSFVGGKVVKNSNSFSSINSKFPIPKEGKQCIKITILEPSQHVFLGITNGFIRHNANIYSQHFTGLTFWGFIYSRGEHIDLLGKLKLQSKPTIVMTIDFESQSIRWYSDEQLIGETVLAPQFKYSELYVVFGMRDKDISVAFLEE